MSRRTWVLGLAVLVVTGCQASGGSLGPSRVRTELAPEASNYTIAHIGLLTLANATNKKEAGDMARYVTAALSERGLYQLSTVEGFAEDARRAGVGEDYEKMVRSWRNSLLLDATVVRRVLGATHHDAVLCMEVNRWEQVTVDPNVEGTSDTSVGLRLALFAADGTKLWSGQDQLTEHSATYDPSAHQSSTDTGRLVTGGTVPTPPPFEKVGVDLSRAVVAAMPDLRAKPPASGS